MRIHPGLGLTVCVVATVLTVGPAVAKDRPPYVWPGGPSAEELAAAKAMKSPSGLVLIDRSCHLSVNSYGAEPYSVVRDDYVRLLVTSEEGARNASIDVSEDSSARVTVVEGRTVAPDGTVTPLDAERDVHRVEVSKLARRKALSSLAKVNFPATQPGAVLDLHFITESDELRFSVLESMALGDIPLLATDFRLTIRGGFPGQGWSSITLGKGRAQIEKDPMMKGTITARLESYTPPRSEPFGPPSLHEQMTLLSFVNLEAWHGLEHASGGAYHAGVNIDSRGRITGSVFETEDAPKYWKAVLEESEKSDRAFIKKEGGADAIDVAAIAPPTLPVEKRVAALYRTVQSKLAYNPEAEDVETLGAMLKKGMPRSDHGTLFLAYLLGRAGIPYQVAQVCNRYSLRFIPAIHNEMLFDFATAIVVRPSPDTTLVMMPGELTLPFGALPDVYQESLALVLDDGTVSTLVTPADSPGVDTIALRYDLTLDAAGSAEGTVRQEQRGSPAWGVGRWLLSEQYWAAHPSKEDRKKGATAEKERKQRMTSVLEDELEAPGSRATFDNLALVRAPLAAQEILEISADAHAKGTARQVGEQWVVDVYPLMAGAASPFVAEARRTPVWYPKSGHVVVEGDLKLPAGAKVVELPRPWEFAGPDGATGLGSVVAREADGVTVLHGTFEYDQPLSVPVDLYSRWRTFQANLARVAGDGALVTMPATKVLE